MSGKERPKRRGAKPAKSNVEAKPPIVRKSRKSEGSRVRDLEKRLAEALEREAVALEQQTATGEILRVISGSPTDVRPMLDAIVQSAVRLCDGLFSVVFLFDGRQIDQAAHHGFSAEGLAAERRNWPRSATRDTMTGQAILDRRIVHVRDAETDGDVPPLTREVARAVGYRSIISVPMLREGECIGSINAARVRSPFTERQIALLKTFADQAVIAIENVRLFNETKEALEQQAATSEILRVISQSQTDVQPVFDTIAANARRLCNGSSSAVFTFDGELIHLAAQEHMSPQGAAVVRGAFPMPPGRGSTAARAIMTRSIAQITEARDDPEYVLRDATEIVEFRSVLAVPMLRDGHPIGAVSVGKAVTGPFPDKQIALLQTFADQAVIAIENVRLFNETKEALEQQTATSEILGVISQSPTDVQPVFDTIAARAKRLCDALECGVFRFDGELIHLVAQADIDAAWAHVLRSAFPRRPGRGSITARAIQTGSVVHIPDVQADPEFDLTEAAQVSSIRSVLSVPMIREGEVIGAITVDRRDPKPFLDKQIGLVKIFADQAVIAIENVRLFTELDARNRELRVALEQQTATSEILRVISSSPTDVQPVFETIITSAVTLCDAREASVFRFDGELIHLVASNIMDTSFLDSVRGVFPRAPGRGSVTARAILTREVTHVPDIAADPEYEHTSLVETGRRTVLSIPMLNDGHPIGAITVARREVRPFTDKQTALLNTFARQAVIAIENVRLFTELQEKNQALTQAHAQATEALEQQTATSEILRVISSSPTNLQPVLDTIAARAARVCDAFDAVVLLQDGDDLVAAAHHGPISIRTTPAGGRARIGREWVAGRAFVDRQTVHIADLVQEESEFPQGVEMARRYGHRTTLSTPLLRQGVALGVLLIRRTEVRPFTEKQVALLQTFADQAVIAIENARLFTELQEKNRALAQAHAQVSEALEQQTATSEILRVISSSPTDVQPVFDAIAQRAMTLCEAQQGAVLRFDGELLHIVAVAHMLPGWAEIVHRAFPRRPGPGSASARAIMTRTVVHIPDVLTEPEYELREGAVRVGIRAVLSVPMVREDQVVGTITLDRTEPLPFSENQIALLQTFADQAVIAVENVRLFKELEARTAALTRSVDQLTALGEVGRAVSSTLDLETVLTTIVSRAVQLSGLDGGVVFEYDATAEEFVQRVATETGAALAEARRTMRIRKGEGVLGRTAITLEPVQVPDITKPAAYEGRLRETLIASGIRAILAVPMVREGQLIGCLAVTRNRSGEFPAETIELLRTFATQSALAIQNARLFHEIEDKSRQLEAASQHKSEFLANMSHELRTPLNAVIGFSEVLRDRMFGDVNEKQEEYLNDIHASGQHLLSLINDILDLSKIEAGRMELELTEFHLPSAIDNALMLVRERAGRRGIALHQATDEGLRQIRGDERKIKQVLLNLLSNAIKFTPDGGRIDLRARVVDGAVEVSVSDTGVGIAPEDQEAIFEEFRQVGTAAKKVEGTGLGLALSRKFIELHGGRIWVQSQEGVGSTFTLTMPTRQEG